VFGRRTHRIVGKFDLAQATAEKFNDRISDLVNLSYPYIETNELYNPINASKKPYHIFIENSDVGQSIKRKADEELRGAFNFQLSSSPVDHFIIFYQEMVGLAVNELKIFQSCDEALEKLEEDQGYTAFTHRAGKEKFDLNSIQNIEEALQWIEDIKALAHEEVFVKGKDSDYIEFKNSEGTNSRLFVDIDQKLSAWIRENSINYLRQICIGKIKDNVPKEDMVERMNKRAKEIDSPSEYETLEVRHKAILSSIYDG
jgi:hypothetical protein